MSAFGPSSTARHSLSVRRLIVLMVLVAASREEAAAQSTAVESTADSRQSAAAVDFQRDLGLPFDSLLSLGARIERARTAADPVGLASAAHELRVAETVTGQQATLTSDDLFDEAVRLAKLRGRSDELRAVALLVPNEDVRQKLHRQGQAAKERERERAEAARDGERPRAQLRHLLVHNRSSEEVRVYVDGIALGPVGSLSQGEFAVYRSAPLIVLKARSPSHTWQAHVRRDFNKLAWTLHEPENSKDE